MKIIRISPKVLLIALAMIVGWTIIIYLALSDERPSEEYQLVAKIESVDPTSWQNFKRFASLVIDSDDPVASYDEIIQEELNSTKLDIAHNESVISFIAIDGKLEDICDFNSSKEDSFSPCLEKFIEQRPEVDLLLQANSRLIGRARESDKVTSIKFDYQAFEGKFKLDDPPTDLLFRTESNGFNVSKLVVVDTYLKLVDSSFSATECERLLAKPIENRLMQLRNTNHIFHLVDSLVYLNLLSELAVISLNSHPTLANCLADIPLVSGLVDGLVNSRLQDNAMMFKLFEKELSEQMEQLPWHLSFLFKMQKTLNQSAESFYRSLPLQCCGSNEYVAYTGLDNVEPSKSRNWNNLAGYIILDIASMNYVSFVTDILELEANIQLLRANAHYKKCQIDDAEDCEKQLADYKFPYLNTLPEITSDKNRLKYQFQKPYWIDEVGIPLK